MKAQQRQQLHAIITLANHHPNRLYFKKKKKKKKRPQTFNYDNDELVHIFN